MWSSLPFVEQSTSHCVVDVVVYAFYSASPGNGMHDALCDRNPCPNRCVRMKNVHEWIRGKACEAYELADAGFKGQFDNESR